MSRMLAIGLAAAALALAAAGASLAGGRPSAGIVTHAYADTGPSAQAARKRPCRDSHRRRLSQRRFRRAIHCLHNRARRIRGLKRLKGSRRLNLAAVAHARDMARRNYFDHCSPEGTTPTMRVQKQGYRGGAGENIIVDARRVRPITLHRRWMRSPGHRSNILANQWQHLGVGIKREGNRLYAVTLFGLLADPRLIQDSRCR